MGIDISLKPLNMMQILAAQSIADGQAVLALLVSLLDIKAPTQTY